MENTTNTIPSLPTVYAILGVYGIAGNPAVHNAWLDAYAVEQFRGRDGHEARYERFLDAAGDAAVSVGRSVDAVLRALGMAS